MILWYLLLCQMSSGHRPCVLGVRGGRGAHIQSEPDMPTSTRVVSDLGDGLSFCQSHSCGLPREKVVS